MSLQLDISPLQSDRCCIGSDATDSTADVTPSKAPSEQVSEIVSQQLTLELPNKCAWNSPCSTACSTSRSSNYEDSFGPPVGKGATSWVAALENDVIVKAVLDGFEAAYRNEVNIYERLPSHPNIAKYLGCEKARWAAGLIYLQKYDQDLKQHVVESAKVNAPSSGAERLPEAQVRKSMYKVFKGLTHLENNSIVHGDIKPQNILVGRKTQELVIADFGSAVVLADGEDSASGLPFGTRRYLPPESYNAPYIASFQSDAWSAGLMMFELLLSIVDAPNKSTTMASNIRDEQTAVDKTASERRCPVELEEAFPHMSVSEECKDLLRSLLHFDPTMRLRSSEALNHNWFAEEKESGDY